MDTKHTIWTVICEQHTKSIHTFSGSPAKGVHAERASSKVSRRCSSWPQTHAATSMWSASGKMCAMDRRCQKPQSIYILDGHPILNDPLAQASNRSFKINTWHMRMWFRIVGPNDNKSYEECGYRINTSEKSPFQVATSCYNVGNHLAQTKSRPRLMASRDHSLNNLIKKDEHWVVTMHGTEIAQKEMAHLNSQQAREPIGNKNIEQQRIREIPNQMRSNIAAFHITDSTNQCIGGKQISWNWPRKWMKMVLAPIVSERHSTLNYVSEEWQCKPAKAPNTASHPKSKLPKLFWTLSANKENTNESWSDGSHSCLQRLCPVTACFSHTENGIEDEDQYKAQKD